MKNKKTLVAFILSVALFVSLGMVGAISVYAQTKKWSSVNIESVYAYGDEFTVPERTVTAVGKSVTALTTVTYPNGKITSEKSIKLSICGNYVIRYYAEIGSKQYAKEEKFSVKGVGYETKSALSSAAYGKYTEYGANSEGLLVRLANKDELTFTKLIDVKTLSQTNAIANFFITPDRQGIADFNKLIFRLTDSLDDSIYLDIEINRSQFSGAGLYLSWVMAGGNGQDMVGEELGKMIHVNDNIGTSMDGSFVAQDNSGSWRGPAHNHEPDKYIMRIYFDYKTKTVYNTAKKVADLDDPVYYKDLWSGFVSDKARLSVRAGGYLSTTANFCITNICGMTEDELKNNSFTDNAPPTITVFDEEAVMPKAETGRAYKIPEAIGYDDYAGECETDVNVYYGYFTETPITIGVSNGSFTPDRGGDYAIVYSACDGFGNRAEKIVFVEAVNKVDDVKINIPEGVLTEIKLGNYMEFPIPTIQGGSGKIRLETVVVFNGERTVCEKGFRPEVAGKYVIEYHATDYIGKTDVASFEVEAKANEMALFLEDVSLPPVYISGGKYELPILYANDYSSGRLKKVTCKVKVKDANGVKIYDSGEQFIPTVSQNGDKAEITYFAGEAEYRSFSIPVVIGKDASSVLMSNYICGDDVTVSVRDEGGALYTTGLAVTPKTNKAKWVFANAQVAEGTSVALQTISGKSSFDSLGFTFTDASDGNCAITVKVDVKTKKLEITHGADKFSLDAAIKSGGRIQVSLSDGKVFIDCNDGESTISVPVKFYDNGEKFNGFPSSRVYLGVYTEGDPNGIRYLVTSVCGNNLSYRNNDSNAPAFGISGDYGGKWELNSVYTIRKGVCGDVFAPSSYATLTVTAPDGSIAKDVNGKELKSVSADVEYKMALSSYGKYRIVYSIKEVDWLDNSKTFKVTVSVVDEDAPVIKFTSDGTKEANVGDTIVMPNYEVSDNVTAGNEIKVSVYVVNAYGKLIPLKDGANSIKCEFNGTYTFIVCAMDGEGNTSTLKWSVYVK